jgi:hypothetical protein
MLSDDRELEQVPALRDLVTEMERSRQSDFMEKS